MRAISHRNTETQGKGGRFVRTSKSYTFSKVNRKKVQASYPFFNIGYCLVPVSPLGAVTSEDAEEAGASSKEEGDECTKDEPVSVAVLSGVALAAELVARDTEEDHVDDPHDQSDDGGERCSDRHDDGSNAMGCCAAKAKDHCKEGETGGDWVEYEDVGQVVHNGAVEETIASV